MNNVTSKFSSVFSCYRFRLSFQCTQRNLHHCLGRSSVREKLLHPHNKTYQRLVRCRSDHTQERGSSLLKNFLFTTSICGCSFVGAIIWEHENRKKRFAQWNVPPPKRHGGRQEMNTWWSSLSKAEKVVLTIVSLNAAVFMMWRVPAAEMIMKRFFLNSPTSEHSLLSNVFSAFSHHGAFHLLINMSVLWSFSSAAFTIMGTEEFLAVYLSGAVISSFTSNAVKILRGSMIPSVGASGAILTLLGVVCIAYPNSRLSVMIIDQIYPHSFTAESGLKALIMFDSLGILLGWRLLDHAAHLGGVLFGVWYVKYGRQLVLNNKDTIIKLWERK